MTLDIEPLVGVKSNHGELCRRCRNVPWEKIAKMRPSKRGEPIITIKDYRQDLAISACPVCQLLAQFRPQTKDAYELRAYSTATTLWRDGSPKLTKLWQHLRDATLLGGRVPSDYPASCIARGALAVLDPDSDDKTYDIGPTTVSPDSIDFDYLSKCLSFCQKNHGPKCHVGERKDIPGFRVIDCSTRSIIPAPKDCQYVALSYVWGSPQDSNMVNMPLVVEDSISVTVSLGFRYLWVDRYCIEDTSEQRHFQIAHMDEIYRHSAFTIIAAAGDDANYGLPGVSQRSRHPQKQITVPGAKLVRITPHVSSTVAASTWATRGWTYQEGLLPTRRLIFTENEAAVLCNEGFYPECIRGPPEGLTAYSTRSFEEMVPFVDHNRNVSTWQSFTKQVQTYNSRKLSKDSDILNASLGLLRWYSYQDTPDRLTRRRMKHIWGLPVEMFDHHGLRKHNRPVEMFSLGISWLYWGTCVRRPGFPSWSWTGWKSEGCDLDLNKYDQLVPYQINSELVKIEINGNIQLLGEFLEQASPDQDTLLYSSPSPILHITSYMIPLTLATSKERDNLVCVLKTSEESMEFSQVLMDSSRPLSLDSYGLVLINTDGLYFGYILVLEKFGDVYERIGIVNTHWYEFDHTPGSSYGNNVQVQIDLNGLDNLGRKYEIEKQPWLKEAKWETVRIR